MQAAGPHYLLITEAICQPHDRQWRFVLQPTGDGVRIAAADAEPVADGTRLELLAVVRGLEALEQPSRVTLLTANRFVRRGIRRDLRLWRERHWRWERFGKLVPIRDLDLWRRIDRALAIHRCECLGGGLWAAECGVRSTECGMGIEANARSTICNPQFDDEPALVIVPGRRRWRLRRGRRPRTGGLPPQLKQWGGDALDAWRGLGQGALTRTA